MRGRGRRKKERPWATPVPLERIWHRGEGFEDRQARGPPSPSGGPILQAAGAGRRDHAGAAPHHPPQEHQATRAPTARWPNTSEPAGWVGLQQDTQHGPDLLARARVVALATVSARCRRRRQGGRRKCAEGAEGHPELGGDETRPWEHRSRARVGGSDGEGQSPTKAAARVRVTGNDLGVVAG